MSYVVQTVIWMTPEQLAELIDQRLERAFVNFGPSTVKVPDLPELMTRKEVATYLRISLTTLGAWAKDTDERKAILIPQSINGRLRYRREQVMAVQQEHRRFQNADRS